MAIMTLNNATIELTLEEVMALTKLQAEEKDDTQETIITTLENQLWLLRQEQDKQSEKLQQLNKLEQDVARLIKENIALHEQMKRFSSTPIDGKNPLQTKQAQITSGQYNVFTDGSYCPKTKKGGYGFVVVKNGVPVHLEYGTKVKNLAITDSFSAEVMALKSACTYLQKDADIKSLVFHTDCEGIITSNRKEVNQFKSYAGSFNKKGIDVRVNHVKAHNNHTYNVLADNLSRKALGKHLREGGKLLLQKYQPILKHKN